jgi:hypothetical protein
MAMAWNPGIQGRARPLSGAADGGSEERKGKGGEIKLGLLDVCLSSTRWLGA